MTNIGNTKRLLTAALGVIFIAGGYALTQEMDKQREEDIIRLTNDVRKQILRLSVYGPFDYLRYSIGPAEKGYTITLMGYASRPVLKSSAENVVKKIEAVDSVDNQIELLPTSRMDEDIRLKVYASIYNATSLARYNPNYGTPIYGSPRSFRNTIELGISNNPPVGFHPISIIVKNGDVILEGVVDNDSDKSVAGMRANQVSGVFSVTNNLAVLQSAKSKEK